MNLASRRVLIVLMAAMLSFIPLNSSDNAEATAAVQCKVWVSPLPSGTVSIFDTWTSNSSTLVVSPSPVRGFAYNRSGTKIFATTFSAGVKMIDDSTQVVSDVVIRDGLSMFVTAIAASPVSDRIIVGTDHSPPPSQNNYTILHSDTGAEISTITGTNRALGIVMTPDGIALAPLIVVEADPANGDVQKINVEQAVLTSTTQFSLLANEYFTGMTIATPSGQPSRLYVSSSDGLVKVINPVNMSLVTSINSSAIPGALATSRSGDRVFASSFSSNSVQVIDTSTNQVTNTIPVGSGPGSMAVTPDGKYLYVAHMPGNSISRINLDTYVVETVGAVNMPNAIAVGPPGCTTTQPQAVTVTTPVEAPSIVTTTLPASPITSSTTTQPTQSSVTTTSQPKVSSASSPQLPATGTNASRSSLYAFLTSLIGISILSVAEIRRRREKS
jgi:YVTN family beta-propeller protein